MPGFSQHLKHIHNLRCEHVDLKCEHVDINKLKCEHVDLTCEHVDPMDFHGFSMDLRWKSKIHAI